MGIRNPEGAASSCETSFASLRITLSTISLGNLRYPYTPRHRYHSTLDLRGTDARRLEHNLTVLRGALGTAAPPKSLAFLIDPKRRKNFRSGFERAFAEQIEQGAEQLLAGKPLTGIRRLKGCGLGLTPAGDDFIAGHLIGLYVVQELRGRKLRSAGDTIFRAARGNNVFSNAYLDLARRGLLFGRMKDLLIALLDSSSENAVRRTAQALFAMGETSGPISPPAYS